VQGPKAIASYVHRLLISRRGERKSLGIARIEGEEGPGCRWGPEALAGGSEILRLGKG